MVSAHLLNASSVVGAVSKHVVSPICGHRMGRNGAGRSSRKIWVAFLSRVQHVIAEIESEVGGTHQ